MAHSALARRVLELPHAAREALLAELVASLDSEAAGPELSEGDWTDAWSDEVCTRAHDLDTGRVAPVPADRVLADMRAGVVRAPR